MTILSYLRMAAMSVVLAFYSISGFAQTKLAPVVAPEGSWVVEWTPKSRQCIVRFYNDRQQLIYQEIVDQPLNITHRKTKLKLNMALEQAMYVWNATHKLPADRQWVAIQFDKN